MLQQRGCVFGALNHAKMNVRHIVCNGGKRVVRWVGLARGTLGAEQEHAVGKTVLFEGGLGLLAVHVGVDKLRGGFRHVTSFASAHRRVELAGVAWSHRVYAQQHHVSATHPAKPQGKSRSRRSAARSGARTRGVRRGGAVQGGGGGRAAVEGFVVLVARVVDGGVVVHTTCTTCTTCTT